MAASGACCDGAPMIASHTSRLAFLSVLAALVTVASASPAASAAAQRYASPAGDGSDCSAAHPCTIRGAIGPAVAGDEVIVAPGDYSLTGNTLFVNAPVTIHGVAGQPRPRLLFSGPGQFGMDLDPGTTLRWLEVDQQSTVGASAIFAPSSTLDQVVATGSGNAPTVASRNSTIRDSTVVASAPGFSAITTTSGTSTYRNVTAIATGSGGTAIQAWAGSGAGNAAVDAVNVIARGGAGGDDLLATTDSSGASATITVAHSNWVDGSTGGTKALIVDAGGNQGSGPAFVDPAKGDYRQAPGSPTIDAGLTDALNGAFDLDGDARAIGTTDIGADEFVPAGSAPSPSPTSPSTTSPSTTSAFAGVKLTSTRLAFRRRFITLKLSCPVGTVGGCSGRTTLRARRPAGARPVTLGKASLSIAAGTSTKVKVRVSRAGRRLLGRVGRLRGKSISAAHDGAGRSKTTVAAVTIRRRHR
jgi:hypothetical protein